MSDNEIGVYENCMDCPLHRVLADPDPYDWFCDDDVKIYCTKAQRNIAVACRPYNDRKESKVPIWCPLKELKQ